MSQILWIGAMVIVAVAGTVGFFHSFRNSGDSMPLPFEWLNEYWASVIPLLMFSSLCTLLNQMDGKSDEIVEIRNNPSVQ